MLFVKDVLETNKYKGFTAESYYLEEDARAFLVGLVLNRVTHSQIRVQEKDYIASGVEFEYNGSVYKLCLMTNKNILLDNNSFLGAKVLICTVIGLILISLFLFTTYATRNYQVVMLKNAEARKDVTELQKNVAALNEALREKRARDTKQKLWSEDLLPDFIARIKERGIAPVAIAVITFESDGARKDFLAGAGVTLDESVMRFAYNKKDLIIMGLPLDKDGLSASVMPILVKGARIEKLFDVTDPEKLDISLIKEEN